MRIRGPRTRTKRPRVPTTQMDVNSYDLPQDIEHNGVITNGQGFRHVGPPDPARPPVIARPTATASRSCPPGPKRSSWSTGRGSAVCRHPRPPVARRKTEASPGPPSASCAPPSPWVVGPQEIQPNREPGAFGRIGRATALSDAKATVSHRASFAPRGVWKPKWCSTGTSSPSRRRTAARCSMPGSTNGASGNGAGPVRRPQCGPRWQARRLAALREVVLGYARPEPVEPDPFAHPDLNDSQNRAVARPQRRGHTCTVLGTGKTTTWSARQGPCPSRKVRVRRRPMRRRTSSSSGSGPWGSMWCIGHPMRVDPAVVDRALGHLVAADPDHKQVKAFRKQAEEAAREGKQFRPGRTNAPPVERPLPRPGTEEGGRPPRGLPGRAPGDGGGRLLRRRGRRPHAHRPAVWHRHPRRGGTGPGARGVDSHPVGRAWSSRAMPFNCRPRSRIRRP